jgi:hypothetical protein
MPNNHEKTRRDWRLPDELWERLADVFVALWAQGLVAYDALQGIDWAWLAMDGAMTKAPLGGERVMIKSCG